MIAAAAVAAAAAAAADARPAWGGRGLRVQVTVSPSCLTRRRRPGTAASPRATAAPWPHGPGYSESGAATGISMMALIFVRAAAWLRLFFNDVSGRVPLSSSPPTVTVNRNAAAQARAVHRLSIPGRAAAGPSGSGMRVTSVVAVPWGPDPDGTLSSVAAPAQVSTELLHRRPKRLGRSRTVTWAEPVGGDGAAATVSW